MYWVGQKNKEQTFRLQLLECTIERHTYMRNMHRDGHLFVDDMRHSDVLVHCSVLGHVNFNDVRHWHVVRHVLHMVSPLATVAPTSDDPGATTLELVILFLTPSWGALTSVCFSFSYRFHF